MVSQATIEVQYPHDKRVWREFGTFVATFVATFVGSFPVCLKISLSRQRLRQRTRKRQCRDSLTTSEWPSARWATTAISLSPSEGERAGETGPLTARFECHGGSIPTRPTAIPGSTRV